MEKCQAWVPSLFKAILKLPRRFYTFIGTSILHYLLQKSWGRCSTLYLTNSYKTRLQHVHNRAGDIHCVRYSFETRAAAEHKLHEKMHRTCPFCGKHLFTFTDVWTAVKNRTPQHQHMSPENGGITRLCFWQTSNTNFTPALRKARKSYNSDSR